MKLDGAIPEEEFARKQESERAFAALTSIPLVGIAGFLIFLGVRPLYNPAEAGGMWECAVAGVALLLACAALYYQFLWRVPRRTIHSFELTDDAFTCTTPRDGLRTYPLTALRHVIFVGPRRRGAAAIWLVRFDGADWLELTENMPNAGVLAAALGLVLRAGRG